MSWTQVYISGLSRTIDPTDEDIEIHLNTRYNLAPNEHDDENTNILWGGPGSTLIKRDDEGSCRGFGFLTFYSEQGASIIVDRINAHSKSLYTHGGQGGAMTVLDTSVLPLQLCAELSNPKTGKDKKKSKKEDAASLSDIRLRRQRKAPIRKHPVVISSSGKKTNLGNKNR
mmetsp:Transcript_27369/g.42064  ORF Transcript_27369/g.42064 Transcript_27369/m.42064 type:complete len:171 (+) Transcript_27369:51-563(+)